MSAPTHPFLDDLAARGLLVDSTPREDLAAHLHTARRSAYIGFDPTADSLHVGSLLGLLLLRRFQAAGHRPIVLVGGGTGLIGDPSGRSSERVLNETETVRAMAERLKSQVSRLIDFDRGANAALLVDNYDWLGALSLIPFLRDVGKHFSVPVMLAKESVRARLQSGISFTEFSYQLLQAYDFRELARRHGCTMQMGGSDQWGNITAGIDLARRMDGVSVHGLTHPLVTKADGTKFGKTESGTVWLDAAKTSPYEMYQFWLNTADADVVRFLKYYTFLSLSQILELSDTTQRQPEKREAQRVLAQEVTKLVHGVEALKEAEKITRSLFGGDPLSDGGGALPGAILSHDEHPRPIWRVLFEAKLVKSTSEARRLVQQGGVEVNGRRLSDVNEALEAGTYTVKLGKRRVFRVVIEGRPNPLAT